MTRYWQFPLFIQTSIITSIQTLGGKKACVTKWFRSGGVERATTSAGSAPTTATTSTKGFKGGLGFYKCYWNEVEGSTAKFTPNTDIMCNWRVNQHEIIIFIRIIPKEYQVNGLLLSRIKAQLFQLKEWQMCVFDGNGYIGQVCWSALWAQTFSIRGLPGLGIFLALQ